MVRNKKVVYSIRLDPNMIVALEKWASVVGVSAPEFIRQAIIEHAKSLGIYNPADIKSDESNTLE